MRAASAVMVNFLDRQVDAQRMARVLAELDRRLQALERTAQASHTSIEGGALDIYDEEGLLRGSVGIQPDGTVAVVPVNAGPPPTPTGPKVEAALAGLVVTWDGLWDDAYSPPADFALVQVHIGADAGFTPGPGSLRGTIADVTGGSVSLAVDGYSPVWVRLVAANTAAVTGPASTAVQGTPRQAVSQDLLDGIVTELKLADDAVTQAKVAAGAIDKDAIAEAAVTAEKLGAAAVEAGKIAAGAVDPAALAAILADTVSQRYADTLSDPAAWQVVEPVEGASWEIAPAPDAPSGGTVGRAAGYVRVRGTQLIPHDPGSLYRISARLRTAAEPAAGPDRMFVGLMGFAADKATLVNRSGEDSTTAHFYCVASGRTLPAADGWQEWTGYVQGRGAPGEPVAGTIAPDPLAPALLHDQVRHIAPYLWLHYDHRDPAGVVEIDSVTVEVLRTGVVTAANLAAGSVTAAALAAGSVTAGALTADAVTAAAIAAGAVTTAALAAGSVTAGALAAGSVQTEHLVAGAVQAATLAADAVTAGKIAADAITGREIKALAVTAAHLAVNSVTATHIQAGAIEATHLKTGAVTTDKLSVGTTGNMVGDASYETGLMAAALAGGEEFYAVEDGGNGSAKCLRITAAAGFERWVQHGTSPMQAGDRYWIAADYKTSPDLTGATVNVHLACYTQAGSRLASEGADATAPVTDGTWQRISAIVTVPEGATRGHVRVGVTPAGQGAAGKVYFDNLECRAVYGTRGAGPRAEISPQGLRLYDGQGEEAVSLVTGHPNYLTLTNDGTPVATIDQDGNTGVADLAVAGRLTVGGDPIETHLASVARGLVAIDYQATSVTAGTTDYGFVELSFDADASRMYRIVLDCYADPSVAGGELFIALRDGGASTPSISSTQIQSAIYPMPTAGYRRVRMEAIRSGSAFGAGLHRLLVTFRCTNGPSGQTVRMFGGSNHHGVFYIEDVGPYIPETGQYNTGGGTTTPPKKTYTKTYSAAWSGSYANRGSYNGYYGNKMLQGYYSSTNGVQAALVGFSSSLASDLAGATIQKAEVYLYFDHWYYNSGGQAVIKAHSHTSRPSTFSSDGESKTVSWARNEGKWVDITSVFDSTSWRGIALDPNSTSRTYYGRARGHGETYPPKLRVTYQK